jgi:L-malate glycosyltransferase
MTQTVAIIQRRLTDYRVPLFELMRKRLAEQDIMLRVLQGNPSALEATKNDGGVLAWAEHLPTRYLAGGRICWQPFMHRVRDCDLVVITQENKLVNNLWPLLDPWRRPKLAFWGHGRNMQSTRQKGLLERFKRWTTRHVDWWFAYTEMSAGLVREAGFEPHRITVLNNSIDMASLGQAIALARQKPKAELRARFNLPAQGPVGLYIGSLYAEKRIPLLIAAAREVHRQLPDFRLLIAGAGPDQGLVERAAAESAFITFLGSVYGERKAEVLATSDLLLNPGLVGLGILDAFAAGIPILTTDCRLHSPEISYLVPGYNGLIAPESQSNFSESILHILQQPDQMKLLCAGAAASANEYSVDRMARRFCGGIWGCLSP